VFERPALTIATSGLVCLVVDGRIGNSGKARFAPLSNESFGTQISNPESLFATARASGCWLVSPKGKGALRGGARGLRPRADPLPARLSRLWSQPCARAGFAPITAGSLAGVMRHGRPRRGRVRRPASLASRRRRRQKHTVRCVTFSRSANARMLSPAALPSTMQVRVASAWGELWLRSHASSSRRSASLNSAPPSVCTCHIDEEFRYLIQRRYTSGKSLIS
jgi:hypothetical protein